jgi:3D-(3,5/4)-trihydroxycyclohexane-1,2-dione acylhydrolase (decyclizing)
MHEIAGGLGVKRGLVADGDDRDVIVMVGDGSYLMLNTELVTAVAEGIKIILVIVQNHGYASIGHLSETVGSERFGTRFLGTDGDLLPIDLAMNARSYGLDVIEIAPGASAIEDLKAAVTAAKASESSVAIHITSDPLVYAPDGGSWWDVPVAEVSTLAPTQWARDAYEQNRLAQRPLIGGAGSAENNEGVDS